MDFLRQEVVVKNNKMKRSAVAQRTKHMMRTDRKRDLPVQWERDIGWHLPQFAPTVVDAFRIRIARVVSDFAPGSVDASLPVRFPASVLRRRSQGRFLSFADCLVVPSRLVSIQVVMERSRWSDSSSWPRVSLCEVGGLAAFTGFLGLSMTGVPSLYGNSVEILRIAPNPDSVLRMAKAFEAGIVSRRQATLALGCNSSKLAALCKLASDPRSPGRHKVLAVWARRVRGAPARRSRRRAAFVSEGERQALATAEALPCYVRWRTGTEEEDAMAYSQSLGRLEPALNLPSGVGWERRLYADGKKSPQVKWMTARAIQMLEEMARAGSCARHVIDVGGGRGDLSLAVAAALGPGSLVTVVDTNSESLAAGRARATEEGLAGSMRFVDDDIERVVACSDAGALHCDLVIGLHACGGLGEYAVALAIERGASFLVCTCCFNSNPHLALLTRRDLAPLPLETVKLLCHTAEKVTDPPSISRRAMQAINSVRLSTIETLFAKKHPGRRILLQQRMFPVRFSPKNCVLFGLVLPM